METNELGILGELKVTSLLIEKGFSVFTQVGEYSKVDIMVYNPLTKNVIRIQIKSTDSFTKTGAASLYLKKSSRYKTYKYSKNDCDYFALYIKKWDKIVWIDSSICDERNIVSFRLNPPKNGQIKNINLIKDFEEIPFLNDKPIKNSKGSLYKRNGIYSLGIIIDGQRIQKSLGTKDKNEAKTIRNSMINTHKMTGHVAVI